MSSTLAIELIRRSLMLVILTAGPLLLAALVTGVVVSLIQALTQLQEQTLTFIPKLLVMGLILLVTLPWMLGQLIQFLVQVFSSLPSMAS
jgi:flagellar biosynthetic protein FliQ